MNKSKPDLKGVLGSPQAAELLKNRQGLENLMKSGEAQRLMELLNRNAGGGLKDAAQSAMEGDATRLMSLVEGLKKDPKSAKLVAELSKKTGK